jgi:precorrin-4/cobalt-precorrin-4 C11-methyltransferase
MPPGEDLRTLASAGATLVLHLAVANIDQVVTDLLPRYGPDCPAAVVARASWPDEDVLRCRLGELPDRVRGRGIRRTAIVIIGPVLGQDRFDDSHLYSPGRDRGQAGAGDGRAG